MKLNYITILVKDLEKSLAFYTELVGLKIIRRFNPGPGEIVFLANQEGETMIELIGFSEEKICVKGMVMSYEIEESLETYRDKAIALGYEATDIIECQSKPRYFRVMDPDGIIVEFSK